jgi:aerobic-type carbon monoxide dehydrogenase small subunit (CoxS/CutS family)
MAKTIVRLQVNGTAHEVAVGPQETLAQALREACGLTGTKVGCDLGTCGCCTVLLDGHAALSCLTLALEAEGRRITTIEGLAPGVEAGSAAARGDSGQGQLHPVQEAFATCGGAQCGYCTPGFVMASVALLDRNPSPSREQIKDAISGNLCRCTGYVKIVDAIERAADRMRAARTPADAPSRDLQPSA